MPNLEKRGTLLENAGRANDFQTNVRQNPSEEVEPYKESPVALKAELEKMRNVVYSNKFLMITLVVDALKTKTVSKSLTMEVQERRKSTMDL